MTTGVCEFLFPAGTCFDILEFVDDETNPSMPGSDSSSLHPPLVMGEEAFGEALATLQVPFRAYLAALLPGCTEIDDVLQEVNLLLWERREEFAGPQNVRAYGLRCAYFKALSWRRNAARAGWVVFDEGFMETLAQAVEESEDEQALRRAAALDECVRGLRSDERSLLKARYEERAPLNRLAALSGKTEDAVYKTISRVREALRLCVKRKLAREDHPRS